MGLTIAYRLIITGLVQGVGFRPFIHRLAHSLGLNGHVKNIGGSEAEVWIEGSEERIEEFLARLWSDKPPPAVIELRRDDIKVYIPSKIPLGDGSIGFGQIIAASLISIYNS
jgi:hydrogenase maturation factor HypF (carbamoyltransferase family)